MTGQTCALPGCDKPPWPSVRPGDAPALACGNLHHQLLMASRFNPVLPDPPHQAILDLNAAGLCALRGCRKAPCSGHSWCTEDHYLLWLAEFTASLQREQICMLQGCTRHVFVEENRPPSRFCGWRHRQKFVMLSALRGQMPSVDVNLLQLPPSPASLSESEHDPRPSLKSLMHSFKQFAHSRIPPKNIIVMDDFYEKHPWEVFTAAKGHDCWLIVCLQYTSKGRKLTTKGHYHWKQSGPRAKRNKYPAKYYTYAKRKGKEQEVYQHHAEKNSYTMKEYTMEDVQRYALVHLVKEKKASFGGKLGEAEPANNHEIAEHIEDACSQGSATSKLLLWDDEFSGDSTFRGLPPL